MTEKLNKPCALCGCPKNMLHMRLPARGESLGYRKPLPLDAIRAGADALDALALMPKHADALRKLAGDQ